MTTFLPSNHSSFIPKGRQVREQLHCIYEVNPTAGKPSAKLTSAGIRTGGIEGEIREGLYILDCHLATYIRYQGALLWTKLLQVGEGCAVPGATASEKISTAGQRTLSLQRLGFYSASSQL